MIKHPRTTQLVNHVLHAMSALLCCGPVFDTEVLGPSNYLYSWLENMLSAPEEKVLVGVHVMYMYIHVHVHVYTYT